ncbi:MAG TPA: rhodanese-like domain-containing protein [Polyangiaceae bacterium]|nr:rhodanese-like domain-containing protein [Polyangiaceae bacterium]
MFQALNPQQAQQIISRGEVAVVDVRERREWSEGHIAGARLVPLGELVSDLRVAV